MSIAAVKQQIGKILNLHGGSIPDHEYQGLLAFAEQNGVDERQLRYQLLPDMVNSFNVVAHERQRELAVQQIEHYIKERFSVDQELKPIELERIIGFAYDLDIPRSETLKRLRLLGFEFQDGPIQGFRPHRVYARYPDRKTGFSVNQLSAERDEESLYEVDVTSPDEAVFRLLVDSKALAFAVDDLSTFLNPVCEYPDSPQRGCNAKNIQPGSLRLEDKIWSVARKAQITFDKAGLVPKADAPALDSHSVKQAATKIFPNDLMEAIRKQLRSYGMLTEEQVRQIQGRVKPLGFSQEETLQVLQEVKAEVAAEKASKAVVLEDEMDSERIVASKPSHPRWKTLLYLTLAVAMIFAFVKLWDFIVNWSGTSVAPPVEWHPATTPILCKYKASSNRSPIRGKTRTITYEVAKIHDDDITTAWVEGASGLGVGEWVELDFGDLNSLLDCPSHEPCLELTGFKMYNGLGTNNWKRNGRVSKFKLTKNGETVGFIQPLDIADYQQLELKSPLPIQPKDVLRLTIISSVAGVNDNDKDVCISELIPSFRSRQSIAENLKVTSVASSKPKSQRPKRVERPRPTTPEGVIQDYIQASDERDIDRVVSHWSKSPSRYWELMNPRIYQLEDRVIRSWNEVRSSRNTILSISPKGRGIYHADIRFDFTDKSNNSRSVQSTIQFQLDDQNRIVSEYKLD